MPHNNNVADAPLEQEPSRRLALKQMAAIFGLSLSATAIDSLAQGLSTNEPSLKLFTKAQHELAGIVAEHIIPATDTLGALGTGVHTFLDQFLVECCSKADQEKFVQGLEALNKNAQHQHKKTFLELTQEQQLAFLTKLDKKQSPFSKADHEFFKWFKSLTLFGYYTSEVGASKELAYLAIPGGYKGNFPFSNIGKAWSF